MFKQVLEKIKKIDFCYVLIILFTLIVSLMYADKIMFPQSDVGRELYFPMEVLNGKVLYKDIFNLFGPLSYLFTALIFKIFGVSVSTFYCIGNVFAILMVTGVYMLSRRFMSKIFTSAICLFIIITGIVTITNFSYVTPYASAMLYGAVAFVYSLYLYVRGIETDKIKYFYISSFLAGIAVANKYDIVSALGKDKIKETVKQAYQKWYDKNVYAVYSAAGASGNGTIAQAVAHRKAGYNVWAIGVDADLRQCCRILLSRCRSEGQ